MTGAAEGKSAPPPGCAGGRPDTGYMCLVGRRDDHLCATLAGIGHSHDAWLVAFRAAGAGTAQADMTSIRQLRALIWQQTEKYVTTGKVVGRPGLDLQLSRPALAQPVFRGPRVGTRCGVNTEVR